MNDITFLVPDQIYPTVQVAELLGVSEGTIRSRKSRDKDQLQEGIHWWVQNGSTLWTCAGVLELAKGTHNDKARALLETAGVLVPTTSATLGVAEESTPDVAQWATPDVAATASDTPADVAIDMRFLEPLLEATGQRMALEFYRRLPECVLKHVQRMARDPTDDERQVIQSSFQPIQRIRQEVHERCVS